MNNSLTAEHDIRVSAFCDIAVPLLSSVVETGGIGNHKAENHAEEFSKLVGLTQELGLDISQRLNIPLENEFQGNKWKVTAASSLVMASFYRATAKGMSVTSDKDLLEAGIESINSICNAHPTLPEQNRVDTSLQILQSMIPVISAISRFAFGRIEGEVLQDVMRRVEKRVDEIMAQIGGLQAVEEKKMNARSVLRDALGKLYAESHYAEMDRLLDMPPDERAEYVLKHDQKPPMELVWTAFQLRSDLLVIVAQHMGSSWR